MTTITANTTSQLNTTNANTVPADNLTTVLHSAVAVPIDSVKGKTPAPGNRYCKLIKKGENSKLAESVAVEVPDNSYYFGEIINSHPAIATYLQAAMKALKDGAIKALIVAGAKDVKYSELSLDKLNVFAASENEANGNGHISSDRITAWFDASLRDLWIVALANKLGISDTATDADIKRLEQIANQTRDNLAKLSSKKPVMFDARIKNALNAALSCAAEDDNFALRIAAKLNAAVNDSDMLANLGL